MCQLVRVMLQCTAIFAAAANGGSSCIGGKPMSGSRDDRPDASHARKMAGLAIRRDPVDGRIAVVIAGSIDVGCGPRALRAREVAAVRALVGRGLESIPERLDSYVGGA